MSERIRLRAWDKETNEMLYDNLNLSYEEDIGLFLWKEDKFGDWYELPLMRYANIWDKNKQDIYEGDIIECWNEEGFLINFDKVTKYIVEFNGNKFIGKYLWANGYNEYEDWNKFKNIKVVGNIYQHPELTIFELSKNK